MYKKNSNVNETSNLIFLYHFICNSLTTITTISTDTKHVYESNKKIIKMYYFLLFYRPQMIERHLVMKTEK